MQGALKVTGRYLPQNAQ